MSNVIALKSKLPDKIAPLFDGSVTSYLEMILVRRFWGEKEEFRVGVDGINVDNEGINLEGLL